MGNGKNLIELLYGNTNHVLLNGEEILATATKTLQSVSAVLLSHSKDPDARSEEDGRMQRALIMPHACYLCDLGLYPKKTQDQIMHILGGFDIVAGMPHKINTGNEEVDSFVNDNMIYMEE